MKTFDNCFYVGSIDEFRKDNYDKNNNCVKKSFLDSLEKRYNNIYPNGRDIDNERKA
ncbi:MAG: hypothetical protein Q4F54_01825 [Coriobacteriia bacterium]|nr:hypothetical protein [Coriobacteriia bacterium]